MKLTLNNNYKTNSLFLYLNKYTIMKTKKDFWKTAFSAYVLIFSGIILLFITDENNPFELYFLIGVIVIEVLGLIVIGRALRIYRSLEDKSIYPKKLDFLNKLAMKLYSDKKTSNKVITIAILIGASIGIVIGLEI